MAAKSAYKPKQNITLGSNSLHRGYFSLFREKASTANISWSLTNSKGEPAISPFQVLTKIIRQSMIIPIKQQLGNFPLHCQRVRTSFFINASANTSYILQLQLNNTYSYFGGSPRGEMGF
jgi:hypothetical protein